jgi:hypothetical protein
VLCLSKRKRKKKLYTAKNPITRVLGLTRYQPITALKPPRFARASALGDELRLTEMPPTSIKQQAAMQSKSCDAEQELRSEAGASVGAS